jgi:hypothetical protein
LFASRQKIYLSFTLIEICLALLALGRVMVRTPFSNMASIFSDSISTGNIIERENEPQ